MAKPLIVIDPQPAGISGDMLLAALIDLGASERRVAHAISEIASHLPGCRSVTFDAAVTTVDGVAARRVMMSVDEERRPRAAAVLRGAVTKIAKEVALTGASRQIALGALERLLSAEARVHGTSGRDPHLHELGSADTIADLVGVARAFLDLGLAGEVDGAEIVTLPPAVGAGLFAFSHGTVPTPGPATLEILREAGIAFHGGPVTGELTTPTGAALLAELVTESLPQYPPMVPKKVGYGAGHRVLEGVPNILRVVSGERLEPRLSDQVTVIETTLDDVPGTLVGNAVDRLLALGARDVSVIPVLGKKGRPGYIVKVLAEPTDLQRLGHALMAETGTLGVRFYAARRYVERRSRAVRVIRYSGRSFRLAVKQVLDSRNRVLSIRPEHEDLRSIAAEVGRPLREVAQDITRLLRQQSRRH